MKESIKNIWVTIMESNPVSNCNIELEKYKLLMMFGKSVAIFCSVS
jgi:hypothetical protein